MDYTPYAIQHINLSVPEGTLPAAEEFYGNVLGFYNDPVPALQRDVLRWFSVGTTGQQVHISFGPVDTAGRNHPCFSLKTPEALLALQKRIFEHKATGVLGAATDCDAPGAENSGAKGVEYPSRFFARDYAGNRLEFAVSA
ncbi:uncharacterized protein EHS24_009162 [Apiotrichum porosum]|uniref:VOC domain-containing protein n=1 Tax=Apiotrichum porosum TaxID=105984 RepID=A0A427XP13_9TREE|nr:uncharacterized protein EHS24_009162 [Apiotrichum porosum]RSH80580.1 hypothetical protein EHS24_009162 [Apiotrichum porosum]